jgi:hypothetical protein
LPVPGPGRSRDAPRSRVPLLALYSAIALHLRAIARPDSSASSSTEPLAACRYDNHRLRIGAGLRCVFGAAVRRSHASVVSILNMTDDPDYFPKTLWRVERDGHAIECILLPHAQHFGVFVRVACVFFTPMRCAGPRNSASASLSVSRRAPSASFGDSARCKSAQPY